MPQKLNPGAGLTPAFDFLVGAHEVHLWHSELDGPADAQSLEPLLSADEKDRANRFKFPGHRRRFIVARGILRALIGKYLNIEPSDVRFEYSEHGKPQLSIEHNSDLAFNVSHSEDLAVFAFTSKAKIGVDVELVRYDVDVEGIPRRFFSIAEQEMLAALRGAQKYEGFFNCWTRKEAFVKAVGTGLSLPLRDFDVSLTPGEPARLLATRPRAGLASRWSFAAIRPKDSFAAAVVVEGPIKKLGLNKVVRSATLMRR